MDDQTWWNQFKARARELAPQLDLHDASHILNGMARARQTDKELVQALLPRISSHLVYLTSAHLSMLASAVAKAEVHDANFVAALTRELKARLMEFHSPMEITMIVNASSKLRVTDEDLYRRFLSHIQQQMGHEAFHVRDLSVIVQAIARVQCADASTMAKFTECASKTLPQATPLELARLMHACMSVGCTVDDFFTDCVVHSREQALTMDPSGLSGAAYAFGQCFEVAELPHLPYLRKIFRNLRFAAVTSLPLFLPREIVSFLRTYARWQISFECDHLRRVADRMHQTQSQFDVESSVSALYSLGLLMQRNSVRGSREEHWQAVARAAHSLCQPVWREAISGDLELPMLLKAVEACVTLRADSDALLAAVTSVVVRRREELDYPTAASLLDFLAVMGVPPDDDVVLALQMVTRRQSSLGPNRDMEGGSAPLP